MAVRLNELAPKPNSTKKGKMIGKGSGSGHGKTSCKGHKGQKARAGYSRKLGFEGGQMPLVRRIPKRGFTNRNKEIFNIVNVEDLNVFEDGKEINLQSLLEKGIVREKASKIKILGNGELKKKLLIKAHAFSKSALEKIKSVNGQFEIIKD